jgi:hypothetical protein
LWSAFQVLSAASFFSNMAWISSRETFRSGVSSA